MPKNAASGPVCHMRGLGAVESCHSDRPRVKATLLRRSSGGSYYQIGLGARAAMGIAYLVLTLMLVVMTAIANVSL